jgi:hypothetical protein
MYARKNLLRSLIIVLVAVAAIAGARVSQANQERNSMLQEPESTNPQIEDFRHSNRIPAVTGLWMLAIKPTPGGGLPPEIKALITFDEGGGCVETIILPPVTPAHGTWVRTSRREFVFAIVHHLVDPQGNFVGTVKAKSHATFLGRDNFHAEYEGHLFAPNGNVIAPISGTVRGTRITPESL